MNLLNTTRRLTHTLILLAVVICASQLQTNETLLLVENGSERTLQHNRRA